MSRSRRWFPVLAALVGLAVVGCDEAPEPEQASAATSAATQERVDSAEQDAQDAQDEQDAQDVTAPSDTDVGGTASADGPNATPGAADDSAVDRTAASVLGPACPEVPEPPFDHWVVSTEVLRVDGGRDCITEIESRGDALDIAEQIEAQLGSAGYEQTSGFMADPSADAAHVMSFLVGPDEMFITVRQDGISRVRTYYALISPARGNG